MRAMHHAMHPVVVDDEQPVPESPAASAGGVGVESGLVHGTPYTRSEYADTMAQCFEFSIKSAAQDSSQ